MDCDGAAVCSMALALPVKSDRVARPERARTYAHRILRRLSALAPSARVASRHLTRAAAAATMATRHLRVVPRDSADASPTPNHTIDAEMDVEPRCVRNDEWYRSGSPGRSDVDAARGKRVRCPSHWGSRS